MKAESINQSEDRSMAPDRHEKIRTGLGADAIAEDLIDNLYFLQAKLPLHTCRSARRSVASTPPPLRQAGRRRDHNTVVQHH
jgi:hypothetical protein